MGNIFRTRRNGWTPENGNGTSAGGEQLDGTEGLVKAIRSMLCNMLLIQKSNWNCRAQFQLKVLTAITNSDHI